MQESQALGVCGSAALIMSERTERNRATGKMQVVGSRFGSPARDIEILMRFADAAPTSSAVL